MVRMKRNSMKKVLCLIDGLGSGGAQRQLVGLANLLQCKGYDVLFVWYHKKDFYRKDLEINGIKYEQIHAKDVFRKFWRIKKVINCFKPDVVISYLGGPNKASCFLKILGLRSKVIVSERAVLQKIDRNQKIKFFLYHWADYIVSNAQEQTDLINRNFSSLQNKTVTIRNFVDTKYFCPSKNQTEHDGIHILVVGRIAKQKNIERFMRAVNIAISHGTNIFVKWYGGTSFGQENYKEEVEKLRQEDRLSERFVFYPPSNNILEEYQQCDVFCLPSLFEGFPNVVCEAMSCGKPVLCSDVNDNAVIVHDKENGFLFDPKSVDDMAEKMEIFCNLSKDERLEMGKRSREIAIESLSGESFVSKYINLIEEV